MTVLTITVDNPTGLGRIIRNTRGQVTAIVEEKNASPGQKRLHEINTGLYCFDADYLQTALLRIHKNPISKEYYLTDMVALTLADHHSVNAVYWPDPTVWHGVNTPMQYEAAKRRLSPQASL